MTDAQATGSARDLTTGAHLRPADAEVPDGVYRVVGTGDPVALLRVADADGRRVHAGDLRRVGRDSLQGFEPAENPDGTRSPSAQFASMLDGMAWQARTVGGAMADRPVPSALAVLAVAAGIGWGQLEPGASLPAFVIIVLGSVALAAIVAR